MKKIYKILLAALGVIILLIAGFLIFFNLSFPKVSPAPDITVERTPELIERGRYLVNHVAVCMDCHSTRDWNLFSGQPKNNTLGMGGDVFDEETAGVPGSLYSANITPSGIGNWTDGELYRLITIGVTKDNRAICPIMPYPSYAKMDPEDVKSIIAYLRTLQPIKNQVPESSLNFPLNLIVKTIPQDAQAGKRPSMSDTLNYGKYLTTIAACGDCHTPSDKGKPLPGMEFAGGFEFKSKELGIARSANITPDKETGIGMWSVEDFVNKFKSHDPSMVGFVPVKKGEFQSVMPWTMYAGMTEYDLTAIYRYIMTLKSVKNTVVRYKPAI